MNMKEHVITGSEDAVLTNDGQGFAFTLKTSAGPLVRLKFELDQFPEFIGHLCAVLATVHPEPRPTAPSQSLVCLPAFAVAPGSCADPNTALFAFSLAGQQLAISVTAMDAASLGQALVGMGQNFLTLSATTPAQ
jgi:hypothetical protein